MLETFCKGFVGYTKKQFEKALEARRLQAVLAHPTDMEMNDLIIKGSIKNCNVQVQDVTNAHTIFGKDQPGFTVRGNYKNYTKDQVEQAILARKSQAMLGHLTDDKFKLMASQGTPRNYDVKVADISNANAIFGPCLPGLRGQTVREKPERMEPQYTQIPRDFYRQHKFVSLVADVMFVNLVPFMITQS